MDIKLLNIKYKNIREFDDLEISFVDGESFQVTPRISLIQMPNGTGKTTTINLMSHAISGHGFNPTGVKSFAPQGTIASNGYFELHMLISGIQHNVRVQFDYPNGTYKYFTSRPSVEDGGRREGHHLPSEFTDIKRKEFTDLFIFDGELSKRLLSSKDSAAEEAIEVIYHLKKLSELNSTIDRIVSEKQKESDSNVKSPQGLKQQKTILEKLRNKRKSLDADAKLIEKSLTSKRSELTNFENKRDEYYKKHKEIDERREEIRKEKDRVHKETLSYTDSLLDKLRDPSQYSLFFNKELNFFANNLIKLRLPKTISTEFFKELANSEYCVCGEKINELRKEKILENSEQYLSEDDIIVMNSIKVSIREMPNYEGFNYLISKLNNNRFKNQELRQELDKIESSFPKADKEEFEEIRKKISSLGLEIEEDRQRLEKLGTKDKIKLLDLSSDDNIFLCDKEIENLEKKISEATNTVRFTKQAGVLRKINDEVRKKATDAIKKKIIVESNLKISQLLKRNDIFIDKINRSIAIKDRDGVSQGQSLAIAYAYLATLFEESNHKIPFVIDSPAGALDIEVRREVSRVIPSLYDQLIVFIVSGEREGFIEGIRKYPNVQYLTIYIDHEKMYTVSSEDREFFMNFQSEENHVISAQG